MRLLANENIPLTAIQLLREYRHDVIWIRESASGSMDEAVLALASEEKRILLTFDKDFGEVVFRAGLPAECGIVL